MLSDVAVERAGRKSTKLIASVSVIASILLGLGAILFIASGWKVIPSFIKVLILMTGTYAAYFTGYHLRYQRENLPAVGGAILFLSAVLFGGALMLMAQIYHVTASHRTLVLIWLAGVLPLAYVLSSKPLAALASGLFFVWIGLPYFPEIHRVGPAFLSLYLVAGVMLFALGSRQLHREKWRAPGEIYRIMSLKVVLIALFLLTFEPFSGAAASFGGPAPDYRMRMAIELAVMAAIAVALMIAGWGPDRSKHPSSMEYPAAGSVLGIALLFYFVPSTADIYVALFNLLLVGCIGVLIYSGYKRREMRPVSYGLVWLGIFLAARYFDFFWDLLPRASFFMIGGLVLAVGGVILEGARRRLKSSLRV